MLIVTALFSSLLSLFFIRLSLKVIQLRRLHQISFGSGGVDELERAIQAYANFVEYVPLCLLLMGSLELNGAPLTLVALLGYPLVVGRYLHAKEMHDGSVVYPNPVKGMQFTFFALAILALSNIIWMAYMFVVSAQFAAAHL
jgi:uncharacterized membrane protein YecN with MAPEG domain